MLAIRQIECISTLVFMVNVARVPLLAGPAVSFSRQPLLHQLGEYLVDSWKIWIDWQVGLMVVTSA